MQEHVPMAPADYDRLKSILAGFPSADAMNLEELDGFFCALACSPEDVEPEDYFPPIWGTVEEAVELFPHLEVAEEFLGLVTRHHCGLVMRLQTEDEFEPMLLANESGEILGNDWAQGFLRGMDLDRASWSELLNDEDLAGILIPIFALACEHSPDPEIRPFDKPVDEEKRELLLAGLSAAAPLLYAYFAEAREGAHGDGDLPAAPYRREAPKVGRNQPCPCGSGKKYKRCCGQEE